MSRSSAASTPRARTWWSRAGACWRLALRPDGSRGSASTKPSITMSSTTGSDELGAAIAAAPWRRGNGAGTPRPLASVAPLEPSPVPSAGTDRTEFEMLVRRQLELLGEDPDRDGLQKTPERVAKALAWLTRGRQVDVRAVIGYVLYAATHESMVMVRDIELYSMCEHHMLPFFGKAHIAYIPD